MIFIGIDPGTRTLGFSVINFDEEVGSMTLLSSGILKFDKNKTLAEKLLFTYDTFFEYIDKYKVKYEKVSIVIEKQYIDKNPHSAFCLISSRTIFMLLSQKLNVEYVELEPTVIKKVVSGNGSADKEKIISSLKFYFEGLSLESYDEADAIACALSAALNFKKKN